MPRYLPVLLIIAAGFAACPAQAADKLVTVTGEATVAIAPDAAVIRIGVNSQGKTAREASDANAKQMTSVLAAIKDAGVADRDVQTSRLSLQPQYDPNKSGTARLLGFQVTNQLTVKIHDIDKLPTFLDRAIAAGANEMSGIEFVVSEQSKLLDQARDDADHGWPPQGGALRQGRRRQDRPSAEHRRRGLQCAAAPGAGHACGRRADCARRADLACGRDRHSCANPLIFILFLCLDLVAIAA